MSGLQAVLKASSEEEKLKFSLALSQADPIRELGLDLEQNQYNTRLEALTDPARYAKRRQTAFDEMVAQIRKSYDDAYTGFITAGMPAEAAKRYALAAANNERMVRRQILETQFPTGANVIGEVSGLKSVSKSVMNLPGAAVTSVSPRARASRAAPKRRRARTRR